MPPRSRRKKGRIIINIFGTCWSSLVPQMVKNLPAVQETQVPSLGWEDPLEKGTVTHSSIPAWRIPWTEKPGRLQFRGHRKSETLSKLLY